jgi:hypothetical protein
MVCLLARESLTGTVHDDLDSDDEVPRLPGAHATAFLVALEPDAVLIPFDEVPTTGSTCL